MYIAICSFIRDIHRPNPSFLIILNINTMKKLSLFLFTYLLLAVACKKDKDNNAPTDKPGVGETLTTAITTQITGIDSLSSFAGYLKDLKLSDADASAGVTVFAPVNRAFTDPGARQASPDAGALREVLPDSSDLEDYIVKGIFSLNTLTDGKQLTTLSGNILTVTKDGANIRINGVLLSAKELSTATQSVIYSLAGLLKKAPALTVTVWDATKWAVDKPKGTVAEDVSVSLYISQEDYAAGKPAAYTATTGVDGKARFKNIAAGKYYILAEKGDESNILKQTGFWNGSPIDGKISGLVFDSVFQTTGEAAASPQQTNPTPGNVRFTDANGDGKIDNNDFVFLPYQSAVAEAGNGAAVTVLIGYSNILLGSLGNIADAQKMLSACYTQTANNYFTMNMLDGYLSDDVDGGPVKWMSIDRFTFTPIDNNVVIPWNVYLSAIPQLNHILRDVPSMPESPDKIDVLAQAKALRAYLYLQLVTYYGNIPLFTGVYMPSGISRTATDQVYQLIITDLEDAEAKLPPQWPASDGYRVSRMAADALLAKAALQQKDYAKAALYAQKVINSGFYQLVTAGDIFQTAYNKEVIWDMTDLAANPEFKTYFTKGSRCPVIRLPEIYLMAAESSLELKGYTPEVSTLLNTLCVRSALPTFSPALNKAQATDQLRNTWKLEMNREENRYICLQRWGIAAQVLAANGYNAAKNNWLPVPLSFMENYPNIIQNPGY